jgi:Spy/CpxP family protein refolding chaperone
MKRFLVIILGLILVAAASGYAGDLPVTQVSKILEYRASLDLTEAQVKKLEIIDKNAVEKMIEAKGQANIRLQEIEKFTSNWTNMNGTAVRQLIQEYYNFMAAYKAAEVDAILQARAILKPDQLSKYQQLASIDALMISMEQNLALR